MIGTAAENGLRLKESTTPAAGCKALFILAKPGIVTAIAFSGFTGMVVAGQGLPEARTGCACVACLLLMAAGSALINSVLDRRMDRQMARLTKRSLALTRLGVAPAVAISLALTTFAVGIASALLNARTALLLVVAALGYALYYTLILKRNTPWAAVLGGVPGALPVLIGQAAVTARPDAGSLALFLIMLIWQPPHFWLLSLGHKDQYRMAGVPVLPLIKGDRFTRICIYLGVGALLPASLLLSYGMLRSAVGTACVLLLGGCYLVACGTFMHTFVNYRAAFRCSIGYILLLFTIIVADICLS